MDIIEAIAKVLAVGLVLGAGLPALFAFGMRAEAAGEGGASSVGGNAAPGNPALKYVGYAIFALVAAVILIGILWIARQTLSFHFGWEIFPSWAYK
ncbi:MAG: hypothetical protein QM658_16340, partial [Gordonia sp. (in: high G+C Gram-positive bacteria)]